MPIPRLTPKEIQNGRKNNPPTEGWFFDGLEKFLNEIDQYLEPCDDPPARSLDPKKLRIPKEDQEGCGLCCIELFYFYDRQLIYNPAFANGIWIKVYNINGIDTWLHIVLNERGRKKVDIYSPCPIDCEVLSEVEFGLPHNFTPQTIWKTNNTVADLDWQAIVNQTCQYLKCACVAKCI